VREVRRTPLDWRPERDFVTLSDKQPETPQNEDLQSPLAEVLTKRSLAWKKQSRAAGSTFAISQQFRAEGKRWALLVER
jgi:hypothetical protein